MSETLEERAVKAVQDYARHAVAVTDLTRAISMEHCPDQDTPGTPPDDVDLGPSWWGSSCYSRQAAIETDAEGGRLSLDEIAREVADCESCTRLVKMIRERREERRLWGLAKRRVRRVGKRLLETC